MSMRLMFVDIADNLVTNAEYWAFCEATGRDKGKTSTGRPKQPVVNVSWYDAMDYACWKAEQDGIPWRLPLEEELKEAEALIPADADFSEWPLKELPDVGTHPQTSNSLGHNDLVGVVYQWTMRPEDKTKYDTTWEEYVQKRKAAEEAWIREQSWKTDAEMSEIIAIPEVEVTTVLCEGDPTHKPPTQAEIDLLPARTADWGSVQPRPKDLLDPVVSCRTCCVIFRGAAWSYPEETSCVATSIKSGTMHRVGYLSFRLVLDADKCQRTPSGVRAAFGGQGQYTATRDAARLWEIQLHPTDTRTYISCRLTCGLATPITKQE